VNYEFYLEVLVSLRESVRRTRPELWPDQWILHHDSASAQDALRDREFLAKKSITKLDNPSHLHDLAPEILAFSKLKNALKGQRFAGIPAIQPKVTMLLRGIFNTVSGSGTTVSQSA
jgi:hypothetical protein